MNENVLSEDDVRKLLLLHIWDNFKTQAEFAKSQGVNQSIISSILTKNKNRQRPIPDEFCALVGVQRKVTYEKVDG